MSCIQWRRVVHLWAGAGALGVRVDGTVGGGKGPSWASLFHGKWEGSQQLSRCIRLPAPRHHQPSGQGLLFWLCGCLCWGGAGTGLREGRFQGVWGGTGGITLGSAGKTGGKQGTVTSPGGRAVPGSCESVSWGAGRMAGIPRWEG